VDIQSASTTAGISAADHLRTATFGTRTGATTTGAMNTMIMGAAVTGMDADRAGYSIMAIFAWSYSA
jgi:hypothetical protein